MDEIMRNFLVSIKLSKVSSGFKWMILGVYGPSKPHHRAEFWNEFLYVKAQWGGLGVVRIRFTHEKSRPSITRSMRDFNSFINLFDLCDSSLLNAKFKWTDGKEIPILSRLDRFLVSNGWEEVYLHFTQEEIPKIVFDHWPIMLKTPKVNYGPIPFHFENMWVSHPKFKDQIHEWWSEMVLEGYKGFGFMKKLQYIKQKLRVWNRNTFGHIKKQKDSIWIEMGSLDRKLEEDGVLPPHLEEKKEGTIRGHEVYPKEGRHCGAKKPNANG